MDQENIMIDLRSDTVTKPTDAMRDAMYQAEVGDDVYGDDPTVNRLEKLTADMLGTESAIFVCSGTQSNLLALLSHCERGDEYIVGQHAHIYKYEGGGAAVLGSIQPQPLNFEPNGTLDLAKVKSAIKPDDSHFARTRLLCVENTHAGKVLPLNYLEEASEFAKKHQLEIHLDGARAFNASVKLNVPINTISQHFDSISICLSKGLGAPIGSVLCGKNEIIKKARRWRKVLGGGMRQAGVIAAAGIFALENNVESLANDHENAELLGRELSQMEEFTVDTEWIHTNMVYATPVRNDALALAQYLEEKGITIKPNNTIRLVTHLQVTREDIFTTVETIKNYFSSI